MTSPPERGSRARTHSTRIGLLLAAAWAAVAAIYWWNTIVAATDPGAPPLIAHDLVGYFFPRYVYGSRVLRDGALPLWNPYEFAGVPYLGTAQSAVFYPPRFLLFGAFEPHTALYLFVVAHTIGLGIASYVLFRTLGLSWAGASLGAVCFAMSPPSVSAHAPPWTSNVVWVPAILAAIVHLLNRPGAGGALALGGCLGCLVFAGYPEYVLNVAIVAAIVWAVEGAAAWRTGAMPRFIRATASIAGGAAIGILLSAVQWVPLIAVFRESARQQRRFGTEIAAALLHGGWSMWYVWWQAIGMFVPSVAVACIAVGVLGVRRRYQVAMGVTALLGLGALGVLRGYPPFSMFRSGTWHNLLYVPFGFFAGAGLDALLRARSEAPRARRWWTVGIWLGVVALLVMIPVRDRLWLAGAAAAFAAAAALGPGRSAQVVSLAALAVVVVGAVSTARSTYAGGVPTYLTVERETAWGNAIRAACALGDQGRVIAPAATYAGVPLLGELPSAQGYPESLAPGRTRALAHEAGLELYLATRLDWARLWARRGVLRLLDVRCIVGPAGRRTMLEADGFTIGARMEDAVAFRRDGRAAWVVSTVENAADEAQAMDRVLAPDFPIYERVVLEGVASTPPAPPGTARVIGREAGALSIEADAPAAGYLVVSETWAPGWTATVDGRSTTVERGDFLLQAVAVPAGRHLVTLRYRPPGFAVAAGTSLATLALVVMGSAWIVRKRWTGAAESCWP